MTEIIGVRLKKGGKFYDFKPGRENIEVGSFVIVETVHGMECGEVVVGRRQVDEKTLNHELKPIIRKATKADLQRVEDNKKKAEKAFDIALEKIKAHKLEMNLLEAEYSFDGNRILFNFSADGRVDFRELVKDLASVLHARIELRQIGVRDEAKLLGGVGICGRPFCCKQFMGDFQPVSIKMAKLQGLTPNPTKISGCCGKLMCCLNYEQSTYEELNALAPKEGSAVVTPDGNGVIVANELIAERVRVRLDSDPSATPKSYPLSQIKKAGEVIKISNTDDATDRDEFDEVNSTVYPEKSPREKSGQPHEQAIEHSASRENKNISDTRRHNNRGYNGQKNGKKPNYKGNSKGKQRGGSTSGKNKATPSNK